jgi:hypothetical protein
VKAAIAACPKSGAVLVFPKGKYRFTQAKGNAMELMNFNNIEVDGMGSVLLFNSPTCAWSVAGVQGLHMRDFSLGWDAAPFSQGVVANASKDGTSVEVTVDGSSPVNTQFYSLRAFEANSRLPQLMRNSNDIIPLPSAVSWVEGRTLRFAFDRPVPLPEGTLVVMLHNRESFGLIFDQSTDIRLNGIHLYTAPGFAFAGTGVTNLSMTKCSVAPAAGSDRLVSSTADGFHFWGSRGRFRISESTFAGTCDDCINVHGFLMEASRSSPGEFIFSRTNKLNGRDQPISEPMLPAAGDRVELLDPNSFEPSAIGNVESVSHIGEDVEVKLKPPATVTEKVMMVSDDDQLPHLEVYDCKFHGSSSRGVLAHANAIIERNMFVDLGWAGVACMVDPDWLEGPLVANIAIRHNRFAGCGRFFRLSILVSTTVRAGGAERSNPGPPLNHNITIEDNQFEDPLGTVISVATTENLKIVHNIFASSRAPSDSLFPAVPIYLVNVKDTTVLGNSSNCPGTIVAANVDRSSFIAKDNVGLALRYE